MEPKINCTQFIRSKTVEKLDFYFYKYGCSVATHPWMFIICSLFLTGVCSFGLVRFHHEKHPMKLWIPPDSDFAHDTEWLMTEFEEGYRVQSVLITAPDVLQPYVLQELERIRRRVVESQLDNTMWEDVCFRVPVVDLNWKKRRTIKRVVKENNVSTDSMRLFKRDTRVTEEEFASNFQFDPSVHLSTNLYCKIVDGFKRDCYEQSLLELWKFDPDELRSITKYDIIKEINVTTNSPVLGLPMNYTDLLGGVERNKSGVIIGAKSLLSFWMVHVNFTAVNMDEVGNDGGTADWATGPGMVWENSFLNTMANLTNEKRSGLEIYYEAGRSFGDISSRAMFQDIQKIFLGVALMFVYVQYSLSKCNCIEIRLVSAAGGLACIGLAFVSACGICSVFGIFYGPVHTSLPFLLMGIGVDDMFVIMACKNQLSETQKRLHLKNQFGLTLRHAGVSITITSLTDIVASIIGGSTILPALKSFCLYAAAGVLMTFIYQATFFVALVVIDERRILASQNALISCIKHNKRKRKSPSRMVFSSRIFNFIYSKMILTTKGKVMVIMLICCITGISINGNLRLVQKFDPKWFLLQDSYLIEFMTKRTMFYPDSGQQGGIYFGKLNYTEEMKNMHVLTMQLRNQTHILKDVDTWYNGFIEYINHHYKRDIPNEVLSHAEFSRYIGQYLFSPDGAKYQKNFRFENALACGEPAPSIMVSSFDFTFKLFNGPEEALPAMNKLKQLVAASNITSGDGVKIVWAKIFANWITDEVIQAELYHNLSLALVCVMLTTSLLVQDINTCFWIFVCVFLTLVDVCGMMYYWGLTVNVVSCIALVLAVGLCVDYAAHVGHTFLTCIGTRHERVIQTVESVGAAVINGGFSTLVALSMLSLSEAYIFQAFFKIFLLVVLFGLFHGVVFLPVALSVIGSKPHIMFQST